MNDLWGDVRHAARLLRLSPGFASIAILALALGIGANTAIFQAVDAILLRPLPYQDPERLVMVWEDASFVSFPKNNPAPANYLDVKRQNTVFAEMAAMRYRSATLTDEGSPEMVLGRGVTGTFFSVLGVKPLIGRTFGVSEEGPGNNVVVISYKLWQRRFGGEKSLVGRSILMNGERYSVIGVMPRSFSFPDNTTDYWVPAQFTPQDWARRGGHFLMVVARLKPGVPLQQAQTEVSTIMQRLAVAYPDSNRRIGGVVVPLREDAVGNTSVALWALLAAAGCVLLIACANLANLLLARATGRRREMAVRAALGADRMRLVRQLAVESLLLAMLGGVLGIGVAYASQQFLQKLVPDSLGSTTLTIDGRLIAFAIGVSILTGLLFGLVPAWQAARVNFNDALRQGGRTGTSAATKWLRGALVVSEVALAVVLLVGAGLMIQTLAQLRSVDVGFRPEQLLTMRTFLSPQRYTDDAKRRAFYDRSVEQIKQIPGVVSVAFSSNLPFTTRGNTNGFTLEGRPVTPQTREQDALYREVTPEYLQTLVARVKEGRMLSTTDGPESPWVIVINETFAKRYWPNGSPIGTRLSFEAPSPTQHWYTIVGVVEDIKERGLDLEMKPGVYVSTNQVQHPDSYQLVVRTAGNPKQLASAVREAIWRVDRELPLDQIRTMDEMIDLEVADRKQQMTLIGSFAGLALLLASIGIYGVLSYTVTQQTREIGVRMALGASAGSVVRTVVRHGMGLTLAGLAIGAVAALGLTRLIKALLFGVTAADPVTYGMVGVVLLAVAFFACFLPARRAARVDPLVALREE